MELPHASLVLSLAVLIAAIALVPFTALAPDDVTLGRPRTAWYRISGPTQPGVELGLARTKDGVLHAISNRGVSGTSISETRIAPSGKTIGTSTVATGWDGNGGLALVMMPARRFEAVRTPGTRGINTFTAPAGGGELDLQTGRCGAVPSPRPPTDRGHVTRTATR